jgi:selenocysteine-specific elongation factor
MIVGTAGHIDHGKTALVKALTGVDADRLPEEKARGITLDLGYAYAPLPGGDVLGFVDVPGHERLVRNMLAGATGVDSVLLVVAADDGPMPQTREHLQIVELLGLTRAAVALSKIDVVSAERLAQAQIEVAALLAGSALAGSPVFPVSSTTGQGMEALRRHLHEQARELPSRSRRGHFRLAIDRCFTLAGAGTVVTGTVFSGRVRNGDTLLLSPPGIEVRVRSIHAQNRPAQEGVAGERCALNLTGERFDKSRVERGHWILAAAAHAPVQRLDVELMLHAGETDALAHWAPVHVHLGAAQVMARVALLERERLEPGGTALAQLALDRPLGALHGDRFVIRDQSAARTLGGGSVIDPFPPARGRRTPARLALLHAWSGAQPEAALQAALRQSRLGFDVARFAQAWNLSAEQTRELLRAAGARVAGAQGTEIALASAAWSALQEKTLEAMAAEHVRAPDMIGVARERLRRLALPGLGQEPFDQLVDELLAAGRLEQSGPWLHVPGYRVKLTAQQEQLWLRVHPALARTPFHPPRVRDLARALGVEEATVRELLRCAARMGEVYPIALDHYFTRQSVAELAAVARALAEQETGASAAVFRDRIGTGRKLAIQILEFFDRIGLTRRAGDVHRLRSSRLFAGDDTRLG